MLKASLMLTQGDIMLALSLIAVALGLCIGSFLNVCIVRMPLGNSVVTPPSQCPQCQSPVRWFDNIPVLSYLILRGKCRSCGLGFSSRYPLVEMLTAAIAVAGLHWFGFHKAGWWAVWFVSFVAPLIVVTFIDLDHRIIPDAITLPGIVIGLIVRAAFAHEGYLWADLINSGIGILVGGGILYAIGLAYYKLRGIEGIGGGDVKLGAMFGAFLGWEAAIWILFLSSLMGSVVGLVAMIAQGKDMQFEMPFGPFMVVAALSFFFFESHFWKMMFWYQGLFY